MIQFFFTSSLFTFDYAFLYFSMAVVNLLFSKASSAALVGVFCPATVKDAKRRKLNIKCLVAESFIVYDKYYDNTFVNVQNLKLLGFFFFTQVPVNCFGGFQGVIIILV